MDKKNTWIVIGALVVVLVIGYLLMNRQQDAGQVAGTEQPAENQDQENPGRQSLKDLMMAGKPMKCEFKDFAGEARTTGKVYVNEKKVRVDFVVNEKEKTTDSHMIIDDMTAYTWMEGSKDGYKISFTEEQKNQAQNQQVDPNKELDYDCSDWSGDAAMFQTPGDVNFKDLNSMMPSGSMQGSASGSANTKAMQCAACDQAPESARAQCKTALGC